MAASSISTPTPDEDGDLVERRGEAATSGIAQHVDVWADAEHGLDQPVQRLAVGFDVRLELQSLPDGHDGDAVEPDRAGQDHGVPGRARSADGAAPSATIPIPDVFTKSRSAAPRPTTLVSPVTIVTVARSAARGY